MAEGWGPVDRRDFLRLGALGAAGAAGLWLPTGCAPPPRYQPPSNGTPFSCGVLSGLHSPTEVVLWTRLDPELAPGATSVAWELATDAGLSNVVASGTHEVGPAADFTAKVLVGGLDPDRSYWYRFSVANGPSPIGRARTLPTPEATTPLRVAFSSCQKWTSGWYTAWGGIANEDVDAVLWLGDYIYESGASPTPGDVRLDTVGTANDLDSYRAKYRLHRSDPLLQAGHAAHPFVPIWDDHEFKNNYNRTDLLTDAARAAAAYRVWFEYMPVMPIDGTRIHRNLRWGTTADITLLDTRQYRDRQANGFLPDDQEAGLGIGQVVAEAVQPGRTILGESQRQWLLDGLDDAQADGVVWKLIANQVMIAPWRILDLDEPLLNQLNPTAPRHDGIYLNMDSWDSYMWERDVVLGHLADNDISNVSFLTGDVHMFFQSSLRANFDDDTSPFVANEFVGGAVSSQAIQILRNDDVSLALENIWRGFNPGFRYCDFRRNGYAVVDATHDAMSVTYRAVRVFEPNQPVASTVRFTLTPGNPTPVTEGLIP
ncbi:MAG: alkaline phosphatase D family protein [Acidimicrobiales bacterium]